MKRLMYLLVVLGIIGCMGWYLYNAWFAPIPIMTSRAFKGTITTAIYATGRVEAERESCISTAVNGRIVAVFAEEGDTIKAGDRLIDLDDQKARLNLEVIDTRIKRAHIDIKQAESEFTRQKQLRDRQAGTGQSYDNARIAVELAKTMLQDALTSRELELKNLEELHINAPYDCTIIRKSIAIGDMITPQNCLLQVIDNSSLVVIAEVDERDIARVKTGMKAIAAFDAMPELRLAGSIARVIPKTDTVTKTVRVKIALESLPPSLQGGMTATVNIIDTIREQVLMVPSQAVLRETHQNFVFIVGNEFNVKKIPVVTGINDNQHIEIKEGEVSEGASVVMNPEPQLTSKRKITIVGQTN